jgi:undecaprenyl pyrophosphate synthase
MNVFYIPDGHRRYADRVGCTLAEAYRTGYYALMREVIDPLLAHEDVDELGIFLLSNLNLGRRDSEDLRTLLLDGKMLLSALIEQMRPRVTVRTHGSYFKPNLHLLSNAEKTLHLFIGTDTGDSIECGEVDVFVRSGGELRLSGAPRMLIGAYTQFYRIEALHPELQFADIARCLEHYNIRYMREKGRSNGE